MDITTTGRNGYKIKGKLAAILVEDGKVKIESGTPFLIDSPGEYEVGGVSVVGVQDAVGKIYIVELDNMRTCYIAGVEGKLNETQIDTIGQIDIVVMQDYNIDLAKQVDPWVIVVEKGAPETAVATAKYAISSDKLPAETQTVVLERKA